MLGLEARVLAARLRRTVQDPKRWQLPSPDVERQTTAELVCTSARGANMLALEAGGIPRSDENDLGEWCQQTPRLLSKTEPNQKVLQLRRGVGPKQATYEILSAMASPSQASDGSSEAGATPPSGVSAFIAQVLAQLTLGAWLPAAFLTAGVAVLLQFRSARSANVLNAIRELTANPVQVLVMIVPLLVIATLVTQAFSFQAIRALEGYWSGRGLASIVRTVMIRKHVRRKKLISRRRAEESEKALLSAMPRMLMNGVPFPVVKALEAYLSGKEPPQLTGEDREVLASTQWRLWCDAWRLAKVDYLLNEERCYPDTFRILPTKLGNLLRATEDTLEHTSGDLQGFALRRYEMASRQVQMQHDVYRTRLEMYCTLVFVSVSLMLFTPIVLLWHVSYVAIGITFAAFAAMSLVSYLAALTSADGYCFALRQMDRVPPASDEAGGPLSRRNHPRPMVRTYGGSF